MNKLSHVFLHTLITLVVVASVAIGAQAQRRSDRDVRDAVRSLNSKLDDFESELRYQMQSSSANVQDLDRISDDVRSLQDRMRDFQENYDRHRENQDDVNAIIEAARQIDRSLQTNPQNRRVQDDWNSARGQIDRLASNYGVTANWSNNDEPMYPIDKQDPPRNKVLNVGLSGTYDLDPTKSESIDDIVTDSGLGTDQQQDLKEKLEAPTQIAIDIRGTQVTLATSNASPVTFTADGRDKVDNSNGRSIRLRATLNGDTLTVSSLGGETDYTIRFTSVSDGRGMKVSRRITTDYLNQTVMAESFYNKTDQVARLGIPAGGNVSSNDPNGGYSDNDQNGNPSYGGSPRTAAPRSGNFVVPDGTMITGRLENEITTKVSQNNDRFRMTVQSPNEFRGATIEGYISGVGRSGKVSGQSNVTFNFEKITLRNGQSYDFAGFLQSIKDQNGKSVNVDNEGTARGGNQTKETAKRGGIGGGIGAVIGAIAGGAKGAAIGAIIGAGGGAGSVAVQGKDDIQLLPGTTITVQASSPIQQDRRDR
jgi:hypothetical protein